MIEQIEKIENSLENEIESINDEIDSIFIFQNEINELAEIKSLKKLLEEIELKIEEYKDNNYLSNKYLTLKYLLESSFKLYPLYYSVSKIKNKNKIILAINNEKELKKEIKKTNNKLKKNKFSFLDFNNIYDILNNYISEEDTKIFVYTLCRLININGDKFINTHSLFINQLVKNISMLNREFDFKNEFLESIENYCKLLK